MSQCLSSLFDDFSSQIHEMFRKNNFLIYLIERKISTLSIKIMDEINIKKA